MSSDEAPRLLTVPLDPQAGPPRVIADRTTLLEALTEAAELEHGLLIQYLFAAFTIRTRPGDGLSVLGAERARGWKRAILLVAREEMVHLGLVNNLLSAVGGQAWFRRPDFRVANRYFPHDTGQGRQFVVFSLEQLSPGSIARFVRFEQPQAQAPFIAPIDYETIGELYGKIERFMTASDEARLFVGARRRQETDTWGNAFRLDAIVDAAGAVAAIRRIVEEGEGATTSVATSHHARFLAIQEALGADLPVWPAASNPVLSDREVPSGLTSTRIVDPASADLARLFNRIYLTTLLLLDVLYRFPPALQGSRPELRNWIRRSMSGVVRPLGEVLVQLPSGVSGLNAGPTFELDEPFALPDDLDVALTVLHERLEDDAAAAARLVASSLSSRPDIAGSIALLARGIGHLRATVRS